MFDSFGRFFAEAISFMKEIAKFLKGMIMASRSRRVIIPVVVPMFDIASESDILYLDRGQHEVQIVTQQPVRSVWFSFDDSLGLPVCQGNVDKIGVTILENGFVIYGDINSNSRGIRWFAIYKMPGDLDFAPDEEEEEETA